MKNYLLFFLLVLMTGCSGYFEDADQSSGNRADTLAIENGGGYLSGPSNDITPFLYRDTNGNNPVLFFSSDRDGTYDIYYAVMNEDGSFQSPVKMDITNFSTSMDEFSPVVYWAEGYMSSPPILKMSFIKTNATFRNVITYTLNDDFTFSSSTSFFGYTGNLQTLNLQGTNVFWNLYVIHQSNIVWSYYYDTTVETWSSLSNEVTMPLSGTRSTIYVHNSTEEYSEDVYLIEKDYNSKSQFFLFYKYNLYLPPTMKSSFFLISEYVSQFNDKNLFVDFGGNGEVYFASDRGVNGDYDLFRYNELNYHEVVPQNPFK